MILDSHGSWAGGLGVVRFLRGLALGGHCSGFRLVKSESDRNRTIAKWICRQYQRGHYRGWKRARWQQRKRGYLTQLNKHSGCLSGDVTGAAQQ
jgi:hypothetical protein